MKKWTILLIAFIVFSVSFAGQVAAKDDLKVGFVNLTQLFDSSEKTKAYDKELEAKHKEFESEGKAKIEKIREAKQKLALLAEDKKQELEESIKNMEAEFMEFDRQKKTALSQERNDRIREILLGIEKVVSDYAKQAGYTVILNDKFLIYGAQSHNLTDEILKILNKDKPKEEK